MPTTITFDSTVPSVAREHLQNQIFVGEGTENYMFNMWHGSIKEQGCQISHENASVVTLLFKVVAKFQVIADQLSNTQTEAVSANAALEIASAAGYPKNSSSISRQCCSK